MSRSRLEKLTARRNDPSVTRSDLNEVYKRMSEDESVKYAIGAMQPLDPAYIDNTLAEGERVRNQLESGFTARGQKADYKLQGSATNGTSIRVYSDLDLLTLHTAFHDLQPPLVPTIPYTGDPLADVRTLRTAAVAVLRSAFPAAHVDDTGGKAISISGGSLRRKVDVVIANWWHTADYVTSSQEHHRGVRVYDSISEERIKNKPFLHNYLIDKRDRELHGNLRMMIRLLKSLKYDADPPVAMSSYDIAAIAYNMPSNLLSVPRTQELQLVAAADSYLTHLVVDERLRDGLLVPNEMRKIFGNDGASLASLQHLKAETGRLLSDIQASAARSFRKLEEMRTEY